MNDLQLKPLHVKEIVIGEQKEKKYLGKYFKQVRGGFIFEYDPVLHVVTKQELVEGKVFCKKDCFYVEALNLRNAIKRFEKGKLICRT